MKYRTKELFKYSDVVYIPIENDNDLEQIKYCIHTYSNYHKIQTKMTIGIFVNGDTGNTERVMKVEYLRDDFEKKKDIEDKKKRIRGYLDKRMSLREIAELEGCTKQAIDSYMKYHGIERI